MRAGRDLISILFISLMERGASRQEAELNRRVPSSITRQKTLMPQTQVKINLVTRLLSLFAKVALSEEIATLLDANYAEMTCQFIGCTPERCRKIGFLLCHVCVRNGSQEVSR
jgi:hypothetical protein